MATQEDKRPYIFNLINNQDFYQWAFIAVKNITIDQDVTNILLEEWKSETTNNIYIELGLVVYSKNKAQELINDLSQPPSMKYDQRTRIVCFIFKKKYER